MELTLDQALQKGIEAHKSGSAQEADQYYTAILKANPKHPDANHNMGVLAVGIGKVEEALPFFKTALEVNQTIAQFWLSYIDALIKLNRIEDAQAALDQAKSNGAKGNGFDQLELKIHNELRDFNNYELIGNSGDTKSSKAEDLSLNESLSHAKKLVQSGLFHDAVKTYKNVLSICPTNVEARRELTKIIAANSSSNEPSRSQKEQLVDLYQTDRFELGLKICADLRQSFVRSSFLFNMAGACSSKLGKYDDAVAFFKEAIYIDENDAEAHYNIGMAFGNLHDWRAALNAYEIALRINPNHKSAVDHLISVIIKKRVFNSPRPSLYPYLLDAFSAKSGVRSRDLGAPISNLLKADSGFSKILATKFPLNNPRDVNAVITALSSFPLFEGLMKVCAIPDLAIEAFLSNLRHHLLSNLDQIQWDPLHIRFFGHLALQCFTNEYVYYENENETKIIDRLKFELDQSLVSGEAPDLVKILSVACYRPIHHYRWAQAVNRFQDMSEVMQRLVTEPLEELELQRELPRFSSSNNQISKIVREQYEANPYPRWTNISTLSGSTSTSALVSRLSLQLVSHHILKNPSPGILIAGCGTGQQSIETALANPSSEVTAIDLSLASLAFAQRKTNELGVKNVKYIQMDILDLDPANERYDIIECSGVLHHMDNPIAGWEKLCNVLNPGGLMKIGLYSRLARREVTRQRELLGSSNESWSARKIKFVRKGLIEGGVPRVLLDSPDFYSISEVRDLLFHVQEHQFSIPQIKSSLNHLNMEFCGFGFSDTRIPNMFRSDYSVGSGDEMRPDHFTACFDLDLWAAFEENNPGIFAAMYQFYCQKPL